MKQLLLITNKTWTWLKERTKSIILIPEITLKKRSWSMMGIWLTDITVNCLTLRHLIFYLQVWPWYWARISIGFAYDLIKIFIWAKFKVLQGLKMTLKSKILQIAFLHFLVTGTTCTNLFNQRVEVNLHLYDKQVWAANDLHHQVSIHVTDEGRSSGTEDVPCQPIETEGGGVYQPILVTGLVVLDHSGWAWEGKQCFERGNKALRGETMLWEGK